MRTGGLSFRLSFLGRGGSSFPFSALRRIPASGGSPRRRWGERKGGVRGLLFLCTAVLLLFGSAAFAGTVQLPQTGQTKCYDTAGTEIACAGTGQDGEIRAGVAWPNPRFIDNMDGTISDKLTGLIWTKDAGTPTEGACIGEIKTFQGALDYVKCLNSNSYLGYVDWRLPNIKELSSVRV